MGERISNLYLEHEANTRPVDLGENIAPQEGYTAKTSEKRPPEIEKTWEEERERREQEQRISARLKRKVAQIGANFGRLIGSMWQERPHTPPENTPKPPRRITHKIEPPPTVSRITEMPLVGTPWEQARGLRRAREEERWKDVRAERKRKREEAKRRVERINDLIHGVGAMVNEVDILEMFKREGIPISIELGKTSRVGKPEAFREEDLPDVRPFTLPKKDAEGKMVTQMGFYTRRVTGEDSARGHMRQLLEQHPKYSLQVVAGVASLLENIYEKTGIIHQDIKPENLIVELDTEGKPCRVTIIDFGLARTVGEYKKLVEALGYSAGTPQFGAPEGTGKIITEKADVYSLGMTLFALLAPDKFDEAMPKEIQIMPPEDRPSEHEILMSRFAKKVEDKIQENPKNEPFWTQIQQLVQHATAVNPEERMSFDEFIKDAQALSYES